MNLYHHGTHKDIDIFHGDPLPSAQHQYTQKTFDVYSIMRPLATSTYKKTKMQYTELKQKC